MSIVLDGTTGITTPGLTNTGTETLVNLTTTGNTILGDASTDTLNVGNGGLIKDASGNVGVGVTPSTWTIFKAFELGAAGTGLAGAAGQPVFFANCYYNSGWKYAATGVASQYDQSSGAHRWFNITSGTAGSNITWNQAMTLNASSNLQLGTTTVSAARLNVFSSDVNKQIVFSNNETYYGSVAHNAGTGMNKYRTEATGGHAFFKGTESTAGMTFDSSGNLLVGSTSVISGGAGSSSGFQVVKGTIRLGVFDNTDGGVLATFSGSKSVGMCAGTEGNYASGGGQAWIKFTPSGLGSANIVAQAGSGGVQVTSGATSWSSYSDIRLKDVTGGFVDALSSIAQLEPIKFTWKSDENKKPCVGISAQSVQSVLPEAVDEFVMPDTEDATAYLTIRYTELIPLLTAAIQEQQVIIQSLTDRITALENK